MHTNFLRILIGSLVCLCHLWLARVTKLWLWFHGTLLKTVLSLSNAILLSLLCFVFRLWTIATVQTQISLRFVGLMLSWHPACTVSQWTSCTYLKTGFDKVYSPCKSETRIQKSFQNKTMITISKLKTNLRKRNSGGIGKSYRSQLINKAFTLKKQC